MSLINSLRSETSKSKRGATFYFTLVAASIVPFVFFMDITSDGMDGDSKKDSFNALFKTGFEIASVAFFPLYTVILCTLLPQIEYRNNTWKQVFSSPQSMSDIFIAKFIHVQQYILLFLVSFNLMLIFVAASVNLIDPSLNMFGKQPNWDAILNYNIKAYLSVMGITALQFWLGLRFKNFFVPVGAGFALWMIGNILLLEFKSPIARYYPYSYPAYSILPKIDVPLSQTQVGSALYAFVFLILGFLDFSRRKAR